ncbi:MAG: sporulation transcription factor Spo0A [Bacillota bacterium]
MEETTKIAIIDDNKQFCQQVEEHLSKNEKFNVAGKAHDGREALKLIKEKKPDVLLLDLIMPHLDGLEVMKELQDFEQFFDMKIILLTAFGKDNVTREAGDLGADYVVMKPFELERLTDRLEQLISPNPYMNSFDVIEFANNDSKEAYDRNNNEKLDLDILITEIFHKLGVPSHIKGYLYLKTAVELVVNEVELLGAITKKLYPKIAETYNSKDSRVERSIRHAIDLTWEQGNQNMLEKYFKNVITSSRGKPTNSQFIAKVADIIRIEAKKRL